MKSIYVYRGDNRSWASTPAAFAGDTYQVSVPDDFSGGAMTYDPGTETWISDEPYVRSPADDIQDAEYQRYLLAADARQMIQDWIVDLGLGIISDDDKQKLIAWRKYVKALDALKIQGGSDTVDWPSLPQA